MLSIDHQKSKFISHYDIEEFLLKGDWSNNIINLESDGSLNYFDYFSNEFNYQSNEALEIKTLFTLDSEHKIITLSDGAVNWHDLKSTAIGWIDYGNNQYDFNFSGEKQSLQTIIPILPKEFTDKLNDYSFNSIIFL